MREDLSSHYLDVVDAIADGTVVPFLGAGANLCGRSDDAQFVAGKGEVLPSGGELAEHLAEKFRYPASDRYDLARVAQYVVVQRGSLPLYSELHDIFSPGYTPSPLHRFLAGIPALMRQKGSRRPYQLIVTTNYDDALETAF